MTTRMEQAVAREAARTAKSPGRCRAHYGLAPCVLLEGHVEAHRLTWQNDETADNASLRDALEAFEIAVQADQHLASRGRDTSESGLRVIRARNRVIAAIEIERSTARRAS
jgi:hypothetical protein